MNLSSAVLIALALIWAAVLIPEAFRRRSNRMGDSISTFNRQLSALGRTAPGRSGAGRGSARARSNVIQFPQANARNIQAPAARRVPSAKRKRRQDVIVTLALAAVVTLVLAVAFNGAIFVGLHILTDVVFGAYLLLMLQADRSPSAARSTSTVSAEGLGRVQPVPVRRQA